MSSSNGSSGKSPRPDSVRPMTGGRQRLQSRLYGSGTQRTAGSTGPVPPGISRGGSTARPRHNGVALVPKLRLGSAAQQEGSRSKSARSGHNEVLFTPQPPGARTSRLQNSKAFSARRRGGSTWQSRRTMVPQPPMTAGTEDMHARSATTPAVPEQDVNFGEGDSTTRASKVSRRELLLRAQNFRSFMDTVRDHPDFDEQSLFCEGFVYLRPVENNVYNLQLAEPTEVDPANYFTLSQKGITHFCGNESEFTSLQQYEREYYLYNMIAFIPFFKKYRKWKTFVVWKKNVSAATMGAAKASLQENLFILNPLLRKSLIQLRKLSFEVANYKLYHVDPRRTYTLDDFCENQEQQKAAIEGRLGEYSDEVRHLVRNACETALRQFLEDHGFHGRSQIAGGSAVAAAAMTGMDSTTDMNTSSWGMNHSSVMAATTGVGAAAARDVTFTERAAMRTQCRRLAKYIRVADFFVTDTYLSLALGSTQALLASIKSQHARAGSGKPTTITRVKKAPAAGAAGGGNEAADMLAAVARNLGGAQDEDSPLFSVEVQVDMASRTDAAAGLGFDAEAVDVEGDDDGSSMGSSFSGEAGRGPAGVSFWPKPSSFKQRVEEVVFDGLKVVTAGKRLLTHSDFRAYVSPASEGTSAAAAGAGEGMDLEMMVVEDSHFQDMIEGINHYLGTAFDAAVEYSHVFVPFREAVLRNTAAVQHMLFDEYSRMPLLDFAEAITDYKRQQGEFETIPTAADVGIIRVDSGAVKELFQPSPSECLAKLTQLLPLVAAAKNDALYAEISACHEKLAASPFSVDDFVALMKSLNEASEQLPDFDDRFDFIKDLYSLLDDEEVPITDDARTNHYMLGQTVSLLKHSMQLVEDSTEENTLRFSKELDENIPKLRSKISEARARLDHAMVHSPDSDMNEVLAYLAKITGEVEALAGTADRYRRYQEILRVNIATYEDLEDVQADLRLKTRLWTGLKEWGECTRVWQGTPFVAIDVDELSAKVLGFAKVAMQAERGLPGSNVAPRLKARVDEFRSTLPVVGSLCMPALKARHWALIHELIGYEVHGVEGFTLGQLMELRVTDHAEELATIASEAMQEAVLEEMLAKVLGMWAATELELLPYKDSRDVYILGALDDIIADLDDSLVSINTILGSRYVGAIRDRVVDVQKRLLLFQETLDEWTACQRNWMYLETIFSAPDISRQLPNEAKQFSIVDMFWKDEMRRVSDDNNALKAGTRSGLRDKFAKHNASLDTIQKSLEDYLETKRVAFPRFYFLSNDELLEILAQTKDPHAVQPHLRKCFDNLVKLQFRGTGASLDIIAMQSAKGEVVDLGRNLKARGNVEEWLTAVEDRMRTSLRRLLKAGITDFYEGRPRKEWVLAHAGQIVATAAQVAWSRGTEEALLSEQPVAAMKAWHAQNIEDLGDLTALVRSPLTELQRRVIVALVTTDVHARDIVEELADAGVDTPQNFKWQQQLRYYWSKDLDDCEVRQSSSSIWYGYEYEGCTSRLVITPLTDRCWMTLTGALHLKLGGSPAGPAGTGKTESSKDLAKALGIQCIVFNCSDQIDYQMMGKLFSGLAQAGAWTCLDEFNRIDIEVLSVIAQQLHVLRRGRLAGHEHILFEGREIHLKEHHVIITMNPGYAGRTELPDNLKVFFRPVAMMVPDYGLIAEIMLFAEGFDDARNLSRKMTKLYKLSSEQLSQQCHYDYGLRAVKSVLVMAGSLKRGNPDLDEDTVLIRAMRDSNVPKFLADDLPLFFGILNDLFPGASVPYQDMGELQVHIEAQLLEQRLQVVPAVVKKIIQLYETMHVRFGCVIVGPTGAGKTAAYTTLARAETALRAAGSANKAFQTVHKDVLNPKCISMGELYGEFNDLTQEWTDGLASTIMRANVAQEDDDRRWTVFDGPIDALWIENMNTVLDDNMTLCLANSERIKLKPEMRMLFEVQDLEVASPATVSRLGVVYMTPEDLGWLPYVQSWLPRALDGVAAPSIQQRLLKHFQAVLPKGLGFIRDHCKEPVPTVDLNLVTALCRVFQSLYTVQHGVKALSEDVTAVKLADKLFAYSFVWSLGASIDPTGWADFSVFTRTLLESARVEAGLPGAGVLHDFFVEAVDGDGSFRPWEDVVPSFNYDPGQQYFQMLVPTADTVRYSKMVQWLLAADAAVFLTGVTGTGKTVILQSCLAPQGGDEEEGEGGEEAKGSPTAAAAASAASAAAAAAGEDGAEDSLTTLPVFVNFSARTSSAVTQSTIEGKLEKKRNGLLGAPVGKRVVVVVDDVNMPAVEEYGAQPPIELLRQLLDFSGFYDRQKRFWKDITGTSLVVAAAPPGGGRNSLTPRFVRHFNVLCLPSPTDHTLTHIFSSILKGFLSDFLPEVKSLAGPIVSSTIEVYARISAELLPTPKRSHYTFNLRDVSKMFQGILMVERQKCHRAEIAARLWVHESMRVFHDRLINREDKRWFTELLVELLARNFRLNWNHAALFEGNPIMFATYLRPGSEERMYEEARDITKVVALFDDYLEEYNLTHSSGMNLVFFQDAIEHVSRITRILSQPRGNAMLVGVGGSGKQSLTRLAAAICECECRQIELTRGYGTNEFREDLKQLMQLTGVQGKHTVFLFTDTQVVEEGFLEDINNVLNSGEVPNLFLAEEMDAIMNDMREVLKRAGIAATREACYSHFVAGVRDRLHIVLAMSPVGDALRTRCRMFPSLINCTTIDWFDEWPREALISVAARFLSKLELPSEEVRTSLVEACAFVHQSLDAISDKFFQRLRRKVYTTPKSYLDLINLYLSMLTEKRAELKAACQRLVVGVDKLEETNEKVDSLQAELTRLQPVLKTKTVETDALIKQLAIDQADAAKVRAKVEAEEAVVTVRADAVAEVQADAQRDLDVAMPALNKALKALDSLDKKDITEVKSFAKPPIAVQTVMEAVCVLLKEEPDWDSAKRLLGNSQFIAILQNFDKDNISEKTLKKLRKYVSRDVMQVENVQKVSTAATSLCMWVHAMDTYSKVAKEVGPKKQRLQEMNAELAQANATLAEKRANLQAIVDKVDALQAKCDAAVGEKNRLMQESELTRNRLTRAEKLTKGLAAEGVRWKAQAGEVRVQIDKLVGDMFLSAACVSYYGAFTGTYRAELLAVWCDEVLRLDIPCTEGYSLTAALGDPVATREWQLQGLPTDSVSTDNALLVKRGQRWPLMIDPQGQAKQWVRNMEARNNLEVTKLSNPNLLRSLENSIRVGKPLLLEDIGETLDPALEPILNKATFTTGGRLLIHLGDSDVDYHPDFRMYLTTKLPNPHYLPQVVIKVTVINFTVTMPGLVDQLLGVVVRKEAPSVEKKKDRLVLSMAADQKQLKEIEDKILKMLSESKGNILDDSELITALGNSKNMSGIIKERVEESQRTQAEISEMRLKYQPVATRGAIIYFVVADLALIDPMYQYSLEYFSRLFSMAVQDAPKSDSMEQRLRNLVDYQTTVIYANICRGLFETHKLIFSFLICSRIMANDGRIDKGSWSLLLRGGSAGVVENQIPNPDPKRLTQLQWNALCSGSSDIEALSGLSQHIASHWAVWEVWADAAKPHLKKLPGDWEEKLSEVEKLLLVRVFREEMVVHAVRRYVADNLGAAFTTSPPVSMEDIHADTTPATPCIFVLSQGADPTGILLRFAEERGMTESLNVISLGQGQGPKAETMIEAALHSGEWVLLQNCHLAKSWMPDLEKVVLDFRDREAEMHPNFRLFLTSFPASYFPVAVLQNGVKLTNEPPKGLRANMARSYELLLKEEEFETCGGTPGAWKKLLFGLSFFHAVVQERRKFGPLGWNIRYEFNDTDLETSVSGLRIFLESQEGVAWDALSYVTGEINYGGRVTDDWDRRCLHSILKTFITPDILKDDYRFSESGVYYAPPEGDMASYKAYIASLPDQDDPEIFGMHANANITFQLQEASLLLGTVLSIQPRSVGAAAGKTPDEVVMAISKDIAKGIPETLRKSEAGRSTFVVRGNGLLDSLATVLLQEMAKFNRLLERVASSLVELDRAIRGLVVMSAALDKMYTALLINQVPELWSAVAYPSLKPLASWVKDLTSRVSFMRQWLVHGQPKAFPLPVFFFPQGFMTGTLQNHSRKYKLAVNTLDFSFKVLQGSAEDIMKAPADGVIVYGLWMEGARWDEEARLLRDSKPGEMFSPMPPVYFLPVANYERDETQYRCPVYKTSVRAGALSTTGISTNFVVAVDLPSDQAPDYFVWKGAAFLLNLND